MPARSDPSRKFPAAVLFDFDGVIVNSEPLHLRAFQRAAATIGVSLSDDEYFGELIGFDDLGAWRRVFELHGLNPADEAALAAVMQAKFDVMRGLMCEVRFEPLPGVADLLAVLRRRDRPCAICTGATRAEVSAMLRGTGLHHHFMHVTCADDVTVGKPDPSGYLMTLRALAEATQKSLSTGDCLVVEDAPAVIRSVKRVGFRALGVATSYPMGALHEADWAVPSLRQAELVAAAPPLSHLFEM